MIFQRTRDTVKNASQRWYYDACALGIEEANRELINLKRNHPKVVPVTSHLAIGEAACNEEFKGRKKKGKKSRRQEDLFVTMNDSLIEALIGHIRNLRFNGLEVFGHNEHGFKQVFEAVLVKFTHLSPADAIHLASALHLKCNKLKTRDSDLLGLSPKKIKELAEETESIPLKIEKV